MIVLFSRVVEKEDAMIYWLALAGVNMGIAIVSAYWVVTTPVAALAGFDAAMVVLTSLTFIGSIVMCMTQHLEKVIKEQK